MYILRNMCVTSYLTYGISPGFTRPSSSRAFCSSFLGCLVQRCIRILKRRKRISASRCPEKGASEKAFSSYYACGALYARASLPSTWFTNLYTLGSAAISASYFSLALAARNPSRSAEATRQSPAASVMPVLMPLAPG